MDKIHHKYLLPNYIPTVLFTSIYIIIFFQHLCVPVAPYVYIPTETIFLYCGSSENISSQDGTRTWIGDIRSEHFPLHQSQNNASTNAEPSDGGDKTPYMWARLSRFQFSYTFNLPPGQKFIRLHFYDTSYQNLDRSKAFFSVKAGSFTLLSNFSASLAANDSDQDTILKEFCVNVQENQILNITFSPSQEYNDSYAFINRIEIVPMPLDLYYTTATGDTEFPFVGLATGALFSLSNRNALEMVYRVNVGGKPISAGDDTGMYRTWSDDVSYLTEAYPSALPVNLSLQPKFSLIQNYSAPVVVYQTARTMGNNKTVNENYRLTWEFPVDSNFTYLVRLHFCEFQPEITLNGSRVFEIYIANQTAQKRADVIGWGGGSGVPVYMDYAVMMGSKANQKKQNLSIALHPAPSYMTNYSDAILNGVEIFKVDNFGSLAGPNPDPRTTPTTVAPPTSGQNAGPTAIVQVVILIIISILLISGLLRKLIARDGDCLKEKRESDQNMEAFVNNFRSLVLQRFDYSYVKKMTKSFSTKLGQGGYGDVYKGKLPDGRLVAVKVLKESKGNGEEFINEVASICRTSHVNVVALLGFCYNKNKRALTYEFMSNGSLDKYIFDKESSSILEWRTKYHIAIGIARGLEYLHRGCNTRIVHFDIKPHNILLDEDFCPKISDFGLAKLCKNKESIISMLGARGTAGYIAPEVFCRSFGEVSHKSDVYSYGMMILEMVGGRNNIVACESHTSEIYFPNWIYKQLEPGRDFEISGVVTEEEKEVAKKMIIVSMWCIQTIPSDRPSMSKVVEMLEGSLESLEIPPKPSLSLPTRSPKHSSPSSLSTSKSAQRHSSPSSQGEICIELSDM